MKKSKNKTPLTNTQARFVLKGMLATINRIQEDCGLINNRQSLAATKAKAGVNGLILALKPYFEEESNGSKS